LNEWKEQWLSNCKQGPEEAGVIEHQTENVGNAKLVKMITNYFKQIFKSAVPAPVPAPYFI
jgi:hypothetical protein